jgi:DNA helicase-2/ATP-dependent DNA helicase PcrA
MDELYKLPGPILLLAGPGTGKTFQIGKRVKFLVEDQGTPPENITVITFTTAAANNMYLRLSDINQEELYIPPDKKPTMICTMHSLGHRIIKEKAAELGFSDNIRVVSSDVLTDILLGDAAQLAGFDRVKRHETNKCRQFGNCNPSNDQKCKICENYQKILKFCSAIDHNDQILLACKILKEDNELRRKYSSYCMHLLVDEYQDINAGQFELISLLSEGQRGGLFVVGDDDQSIYSWRGGSPRFIREFKKYFGVNARIIPLNESFRCHTHILEGAISIVKEFDQKRIPKGEFKYKKTEGRKIIIHNVPSDQKEAYIVKSIIERALPSRSVLILLPHRGFSRYIIGEFKKAKIHFSAPLILPGQGFPLISTLYKWLEDNSDSLSFRECLESLLNNREFGIPSNLSKTPEKLRQREEALLKISRLWNFIDYEKNISLWNNLESKKDNDGFYLKIFSNFDKFRELRDSKKEPSDFISVVVKALGPWPNIESFLKEVDMWIETTRQINLSMKISGVQLMTLQVAKGLEADIVCIVGLEEGILPKEETNIEEYSRLMFVSMTRAIEELHLFTARKRSSNIMLRQIFRNGRKPDINPSRFINAIPNPHKEIIYHR